MQEGNLDVVANEAKDQVEKGAEVLDVNFGIESQVDPSYVEKVVQSLPYTASVPLSLDVQSLNLAERS